jgi:IS1 family transposase
MKVKYKAERAKRITEGHMYYSRFMLLLKKFKIAEVKTDHYSSYNFLKKMGIKSKSKGSFKL